MAATVKNMTARLESKKRKAVGQPKVLAKRRKAGRVPRAANSGKKEAKDVEEAGAGADEDVQVGAEIP